MIGKRIFMLLRLGSELWGLSLLAVLTFPAPALCRDYLRLELKSIAAGIQKALEKNNVKALSLGPFTGPANDLASVGASLAQRLSEELQKLHVQVRPKAEADYQLRGHYEPTIDQGSASFTMALYVWVEDQVGQRVYRQGHLVFVDVQLATLLGRAGEWYRHAGFTSLFDGKSLAGWKVYNGRLNAWSADRGMLIVNGTSGGWLMTEKEYGDFELYLEYQMSQHANSGVALRAPLQGNPAFQGMEIQLIDDKNYNLTPTQFTGSIWDVAPSSRHVGRPVGEWNSVRILARGRQITVELNSVKVLDADLNHYQDGATANSSKNSRAHPGLLRAVGRLGLQGEEGRIEFRKLFVKPL